MELLNLQLKSSKWKVHSHPRKMDKALKKYAFNVMKKLVVCLCSTHYENELWMVKPNVASKKYSMSKRFFSNILRIDF